MLFESARARALRRVVKFLGVLLALCVIWSVGFMSCWGIYAHFDSAAMCDDISELRTRAEIIEYATDNERPYFEHPEEETIAVLNQQAPFFRKSCEVAFQDGRRRRRCVKLIDLAKTAANPIPGSAIEEQRS